MIGEITLENELNRIAYQKVQRDPYPDPVPSVDAQIAAKRAQINDLKRELIPRPATKEEYIDLLDSLDSGIAVLLEENARIFEQNASAKKEVDDKFTADFEAAKLDEANIREAQGAVINYELSQLLLAYQAAQMLGDEVSMSENRTAYQTLLTEYNALLGAA
jgi:hypothetical protein